MFYKHYDSQENTAPYPVHHSIYEDNFSSEFSERNDYMKKLFLLDTSVLMRNSKCFYVFEDNDVTISIATLEELDNLKNIPGDKGYSAREAIKEILKIRKEANKLPGGGEFRIIEESNSRHTAGWDNKIDNIIIDTAYYNNAILVTADVSMHIKAGSVGCKTEIYYNEQASDESLEYTGHTNVYVAPEYIAEFYENGYFDLENESLKKNEFVNIFDAYTGKGVGIGMFDGKNINKLKYQEMQPCGITPKNSMQRFALEVLLAPASEIPLVILKGPAGTAKTFLSLAAGLHQVMEAEVYRKLLILRPNIKFDEDIGYLKGDEMDKIRPLIRPCLDNLEALLSNKKDSTEQVLSKVEYVFQKGWVTAEALAYLRGRSIANTFILVDEAQNSTPRQMLGILTRAGLDSKIVIVGDPEQIDNPRVDKKNNGLCYAADRMLGNKLCAQLTFSHDDCIRSELARVSSDLLK